MGKRLDKYTKIMERIADAEADIIEARGWGSKPLADVIRPKGSKPKGSSKGGKGK